MKLGLHTMRTSVNFGQFGSGAAPNVEVVRLAERVGYDSVWTAEAAGTDAVSPLAWLAASTSTIRLGTAVMQMTARAPTVTAMTAATIDQLSGGRFVLGLGVSGPAVVEGWHGVPYGRPLARTREYVEVVRRVLARQADLDVRGELVEVPYRGEGATGLARATRLMFRPRRARVPLYLAAMGPRSLSLAYEVADGVIPAFYSPYREAAFFEDVSLGDRPRPVDLAPFVTVSLGDDVGACIERLKPGLAFWIGGMGAGGLNFYNRFVQRLGFREFPGEVQRLHTAGRRREAAAAIPDAFVDEVALCGPPDRVRARLAPWHASRVGTMILTGLDAAAVPVLAELALG